MVGAAGNLDTAVTVGAVAGLTDQDNVGFPELYAFERNALRGAA
jgi:hypothetical protein